MRIKLGAIALAVIVCAPFNTAGAQQAVLQRGYDAGLTGANLSETTLTTANVNPTTFGLLTTLPVDDRIYAQPLYVPQVPITGQGTHNVVYVATMSDTLYAFDADVGGAPLWKVNFASSVGAVPVPIAQFIYAGNTNIVGNLGILSTPVIDPTTDILYLVACTLENGTMVYRLHAVNLANGTEPYPNVVVAGSYDAVTFDAAHQTQRVSLTLSGDQVVFGFGAIQAESLQIGGYSGWMMAYDKQTLAQVGAFATNTTGTLGGGIWQSGRAPAVDPSGFVYVYTGNGWTNGYDGVNNFAESVIRLSPNDGMSLVDWFTPKNWMSMDQGDLDMSSSGPLVVPNTSPSLIAGGGKTGELYVLNSSNLGQFSTTDLGVVQEESISNSSMRGGPIFWQRSAAHGGPMLYDWGTQDAVKAFTFNGSAFSTNPAFQGTGQQIYPGGILALSANGDLPGSGVVWATVAASGNVYNDATDPGILYAFDAGNVATVLYSSITNSARDNFGNFGKLVPPLVANGKVYVATFSYQVAVYGLLQPPATMPTFNPLPGSYTSTQSVTLSDSTPGAVIYYTTNGTAPSTASAQFTAGIPILVSASETVQAIAVASGYTNSATASGAYTISGSSSTTPLSVSLTSQDSIDAIGTIGTAVSAGGIDGGGYAYATNLLGTSITWAGSTFTLGGANAADAVSSKTLTLPAGSFTSLNMLATGVNGNQTNQKFVITYTDGTTTSITQSLSDWFTPQNYAGESVVMSMAYRVTPTGVADNKTFNLYGYSFALNSAKSIQSITLPSNRNVVVLAIDLLPSGTALPVAATPSFNPAPGSYTGAQSVTLSDTTSGAVIYYTTNGTTPSTSSAPYTGTPIPVSATETLQAIAVASGYTTSTAASGTYTISALPVVAMPSFSPAPGTYTGAQSVTLSDTTSGAVIYYTTNGTPPSTSSTRYTGTPLSISATETVQAIAAASGYTSSAAVSGTYTISGLPVAATPSFNPAPGTYAGPQSVTLSDTTPGAVIYYTTNGTAPGSVSMQYVAGTPLSVSGTETVQAIAVASGYTNSTTASGAYTISGTSSTSPVSVSLSAQDSIDAIGTVGTAVSAGGIDGGGYAYVTNLLGTSLIWAGSTFTLGSANVADAVSSKTLTLPAGSYSSLNMLATGVNGNQTNQKFIVTYTDGSTTSITQSLSDWFTPQSYAGESLVMSMAYRVTASGAADNKTFNLYGYSLALNSAKAVQSITLPSNRNVVVLAIDLLPSGTALPVAATPSFTPAPGTYTGAQSVTLADTTAGAVIYYTTNGTAPSTSTAQYVTGTPLPVGATETVQAIAVASGYTTSATASGSYTISALPVAATPTFNPAPGTFSGTQSVALSDGTAGAVIYYTINGTAPSTASMQYVAGMPLSVSATETVQAIAVANGYSNSAAASGTYTISGSTGTSPVSVSLTSQDSIDAIGAVGSAVSAGGIDGGGYAYATSLLGTSITWAGSTFAIGSANAADAASSKTLTLPAGNFSSLNMLATGVNGNQTNQNFIITYTDGTTTSITQSLSDWFTPQNYSGESLVMGMTYRVTPTGVADNRTFNLYGYSLALNNAKTVKSITLPSNRNVVVLSINLIP